MVDIETNTNLKFTDDGITTIFYEGDNVICCLREEKRYVGKITAIGSWRETKDSEPCRVICIDTSKSAKSFSSEIIKIEDITYICKNPIKEKLEPKMSKEEMNKKLFISMLIGLGYETKAVEKYYNKMKKIMDRFDIPADKALACTLYSLENGCSIEVPLKDICGVDIKELEELIENLESAVTYGLGMTIKSFGDLLKMIGKYISGEE